MLTISNKRVRLGSNSVTIYLEASVDGRTWKNYSPNTFPPQHNLKRVKRDGPCIIPMRVGKVKTSSIS